jgi:hypothetical protein
MFTCSTFVRYASWKKVAKDLAGGKKKTCINSTVLKKNTHNSGQILNDRVHAG